MAATVFPFFYSLVFPNAYIQHIGRKETEKELGHTNTDGTCSWIDRLV